MTSALASDRLARHVVGARYEDLSPDAIQQVKTFVLDTIGVGVAGSSASGAEELWHTTASWGAGADVCVWGRGKRVPAPTVSWP